MYFTNQQRNDRYPPEFRIGSIAKASCYPHYILSGPEYITCDSTGHWDGAPLCTPGNKNHNI